MKKKGELHRQYPLSYVKHAVIGHMLTDAGFSLFPHPCRFLLCRSQDRFGPKEKLLCVFPELTGIGDHIGQFNPGMGLRIEGTPLPFECVNKFSVKPSSGYRYSEIGSKNFHRCFEVDGVGVPAGKPVPASQREKSPYTRTDLNPAPPGSRGIDVYPQRVPA